MVSVPVLGGPAFAAIVKSTFPFPCPGPGAVIVIQSTADAAVHAQVVALAVTATDPVAPLAATAWLPGAIE